MAKKIYFTQNYLEILKEKIFYPKNTSKCWKNTISYSKIFFLLQN